MRCFVSIESNSIVQQLCRQMLSTHHSNAWSKQIPSAVLQHLLTEQPGSDCTKTTNVSTPQSFPLMFKCLLSTFLCGMWHILKHFLLVQEGEYIANMAGLKGSQNCILTVMGRVALTWVTAILSWFFISNLTLTPEWEKYFKEKGALHNSFSKIRIQSLHSHCYHIYYFIIWPWIQVHSVTGSLYRIFGIQIPNSDYFFLKLEEVTEASKLSTSLRHLNIPHKWDSQHIGLSSTFSDSFSPTSTN